MSTATVIAPGGLSDAPDVYRTPPQRPSLAETQQCGGTLTTKHYENFHAATFFPPLCLRPHFECVYAFCRTSDDLGDEVADTATATRLLSKWRAMLHECFATAQLLLHPVSAALRRTIARCQLPMQQFDDLISASQQDQVYTHHALLATLSGAR